jgi:hypothetical protein
MNDQPTAPTQGADDWLDAALRADGREHRSGYIADDAFTARVMAALPAPVGAALPAWRRRAVFALWTAAGVGAALALPGTYADVSREVLRVVAGHPVSLAQIMTGVVALGLSTWVGAALALRRA